MKARIYSLDANHREGEQSPAQSMNQEENATVAPQRSDVGIEAIVVEPAPVEKPDDTRVMF
jgi:isopropylmalate/homocitrate/citramalate synthase